MIEVLEVLVLVCAVASSLIFALASHGFRSARHAPGTESRSQRVSVIIAAHNEAGNIKDCMEALRAQNYPAEAWEVLLADDRSGDGTAEIAVTAAEQLPLRIVRIDDVPAGHSPKKHALAAAIEASSGDVLLLTDADCRPEPGWISSMVARFDLGADAVIGMAPLTGPGVAAAIARFDSARTAFLSVGLAGLGLPYLAVGRSWACTRDAFDRAGGFGELMQLLGGDDDLLLQRIAAQGGRVLPCTDRGSLSVSAAPSRLRDLLRQRLRHLSVSRHYRGSGALLIAVLAAAESITVAGASILMLVSATVPAAMIAAFLLLKLWYDMRFLRPVLRLFRHVAPLAPPILLAFAELLHVVSSLVIGITSFIVRPRW